MSVFRSRSSMPPGLDISPRWQSYSQSYFLAVHLSYGRCNRSEIRYPVIITVFIESRIKSSYYHVNLYCTNIQTRLVTIIFLQRLPFVRSRFKRFSAVNTHYVKRCSNDTHNHNIMVQQLKYSWHTSHGPRVGRYFLYLLLISLNK